VNSTLFWKSLAVQAAAVLVLFSVLVALPLPDGFFEDFGFVVGPLAWVACTFVTARVVQIPLAFALFAAVAGGVAGTIVLVVASHWAGMVAGLLVFGASCAGYDPAAEEAATG
jgi:hypothetical protein